MIVNVLALDLSTTASGWATFESENLIDYGVIKPKVKGISKLSYPVAQLRRMQFLSDAIIEMIYKLDPEFIVIEEVNRGISRIGQKTLSGLHFVLLDRLDEAYWHRIRYVDSDGAHGWRSKSGLNLVLSSADKLLNKDRRKMNKKLPRGQKLPIITKKHLACDYVNAQYNLNFDVDARSTDSDIVDAIGIGTHFIGNVVEK